MKDLNVTPFDYVNSINSGKSIKADDGSIDGYVPFIVNRALSYFPDTIHSAQQMNIHNHLPNDWQYDYLINNIRPRKRWSKWAKKHSSNDDLEAVKEHYGYNERLALSALELLTKQQLDKIKDKNNKGGIK